MKRQITVSASFSGKISTGQYENSSPFFSASESFEIEDKDVIPEDVIKLRQEILQSICKGNFDAEALKAKLDKIKADRKNFRLGGPDGSYPSVTTFLGYDSDFYMEDELLKQYAAQGTIIHAQISELIKSAQWKKPEEIDGIGAELFIVKMGSLNLALDGWDFPAFVKKYKVTDMVNGTYMESHTHRICGTPDIPTCKVDGVLTLADVKRTPEKVKNFMQMATYEMMRRELGNAPNKQLAIFPINDKTDQGFSKPIITDQIDRYFEMSLFKRKEFRKIYGI